MKKILSLLALTALTIGLLGSCKKEDPKVSVTRVTLDKTTLEITVGDPDVKLTATVAPDNATDKSVNWSSDKTNVATVDNQGSVHAVAPGEAIITVTTTDGGKTATCVVKVKAAVVQVSSVALDKTELTLAVGDPDVNLVATVTPDNATDKTVNWASDKAEVATVDNQGSVHAVAPGDATITVTTVDGGMTATCTVTVKASSLPADPLAGKFTVDASGKKVLFSKGNLVATINDSGAPTAWKFAANQYDYIGEGGANKTIGTSAGDIDLFGWSTASTTYGISTSTSSGSYSGDFVDWGKNIGDGNTWRTLTIAEWQYLFDIRTVNGGTGAGKSYSLNITYGGKMGVVLYPDDYTGSVLSGTVDSLPEGVVFLPAAGYRNGFLMGLVGDRGYYWSSTAYDSYYACFVRFYSLDVFLDLYDYRYIGYSVRLITDVK